MIKHLTVITVNKPLTENAKEFVMKDLIIKTELVYSEDVQMDLKIMDSEDVSFLQ